MELLVIWLLFGIGATIVASNRGASGCLWFALGLLLGPIGLLLAFTSGGRRCPYCKMRVHKEASACPRCQRDIFSH